MLVVLGFAAPARAVVHCAFANRTVTVTATGQGDTVKLVRRGAIVLVNGAGCGGATVLSAAQVRISGSFVNQLVVLDLSGGPFAPGYGRDTEAPELEIALSLDPSAKVEVIGGPGGDVIGLARGGAYLDSDADLDVTLAGGSFSYVDAGGGADVVRADGRGAGAVANGVVLLGGPGDDLVIGGNGPDTLTGGGGRDDVHGGPGDDVVVGAPFVSGKAERYDGGPGRDRLDYSTATGTARVMGNQDPPAGRDGDRAVNFEAYVLSPHADELWAAASATSIDALAGNDALVVTQYIGGEPNTIRGGPGNDALGAFPREPDDQVPGDVYDGGPGDDFIDASARRDTLIGGLGNDSLYGNGGDDTFVMGSSSDGHDEVYGGTAIDTVDYSARTNDLTIAIDGFSGDGEAGENDRIHTDVENVIGGSGDDTITGSVWSNRLEGRDGNDVLDGGGGQDILIGGAGTDMFLAVDGLQDFLYTGADTGEVIKRDGVDVVSAATGP